MIIFLLLVYNGINTWILKSINSTWNSVINVNNI